MQFSIGTLCINVIMKGQHCDPAIIKIVQEDFIETPWRNTIVDVLNDTERVSETGFIINVPSCHWRVEAAENGLCSRRQGVLGKS